MQILGGKMWVIVISGDDVESLPFCSGWPDWAYWLLF